MDNMPPLPRALCRDDTVHEADYFTADQMHAYARAYAEQRCAPLVEALQAVMRWLPVYPQSAECIVGAHAAYDAAVLSARAALSAHKEQSNG